MEGAQPYAVIYRYLPIRLNFLKEVEPWRPPLFGRNFGFGMAVRIGGVAELPHYGSVRPNESRFYCAPLAYLSHLLGY